jgi:importin subunit alpha-1
MHRSWRVTKPALRTIGNIVCAEDETDYTQSIIEAGAVPCLRRLIAHTNREIQKEACWTLSNIAAGTIEQIQTVLDRYAWILYPELCVQ